jgi:hypothetical protein
VTSDASTYRTAADAECALHKTAITNDKWLRGKYIRSLNVLQLSEKSTFLSLKSSFIYGKLEKVAEAAAPAQAQGGKIPHFPRNSAEN